MSEMLIYRLNQVPDRLYTKFLDLVGIEPFPPSVAQPTSRSGFRPCSASR